jgi:caffeoyl-CoA O-methyltransferase
MRPVMKTCKFINHFICRLSIALLILSYLPLIAQETKESMKIDETVKAFLKGQKGNWRDMNVPYSDGQALYDIIIKNNYKSALEIGTSTGHSSIWIAWALSKTGGRLITIEIDKDRYDEALSNFKKAGVSELIDARLADAHELVKELRGPFDFVFCDADKDWYTNYFKDAYPKLDAGGCYTAHNVTGSKWKRIIGSGTEKYYEYVKNLKDMETILDNSGNGLAVSYKKSLK